MTSTFSKRANRPQWRWSYSCRSQREDQTRLSVTAPSPMTPADANPVIAAVDAFVSKHGSAPASTT